MKLLNSIIGITAASLVTASAATINLSGGFGVGVIVTTGLDNTAYSLEVGGYSGDIFTAFAAPSINNAAGAKIAGQFIGEGPTSLNGLPIFLRVSVPDGLGDSGFAILSTASLFPADVSSALLSTFVTFSSSASGAVVAFGGANVEGVSFTNDNNLDFAVIPEPSVALLGAFGVLGLLRRRR